jgi:hypothetical protein
MGKSRGWRAIGSHTHEPCNLHRTHYLKAISTPIDRSFAAEPGA